jgi:hypothetical protein
MPWHYVGAGRFRPSILGEGTFPKGGLPGFSLDK